jgi:spore coat protein U-like protein
MKKHLIVLAAIVMVVMMAGGVWAAPGDVTVQATVADKCAAISGNATIDMGTVDGVTDAAGVANMPITTNTLSLKCTKDANVTITLGGTGNLHKGADVIAYTLAGDTAMLGLGFGAGGELLSAWNLTASIAAAGLDAAPAGVYTDTVTVTILP